MTYLLPKLSAALFGLLLAAVAQAASLELLNVSYDPTRELFKEYNVAFQKHYKEQTGDSVIIRQSHGGSAGQARSVIDGLPADVVTLALAYDIDTIAAKTNKLDRNWQQRLPHNSAPYTSTIVFLVRAGNPQHIKDWDDLIRPDIKVITPNPKTSGGARWNYLAAWAYAKKKYGNDDQARQFVARLYANVPILDNGARGATNTFVQRGSGDVLLAWENEAHLIINQPGNKAFAIVVPSLSIRAEPKVAVVDANAAKRGTTAVARAYLDYLYSAQGQKIAAHHYYRPTDAEVTKQFAHQFPTLELVDIDSTFGGWAKAQSQHFADGGEFDKLYNAKK